MLRLWGRKVSESLDFEYRWRSSMADGALPGQIERDRIAFCVANDKFYKEREFLRIFTGVLFAVAMSGVLWGLIFYAWFRLA